MKEGLKRGYFRPSLESLEERVVCAVDPTTVLQSDVPYFVGVARQFVLKQQVVTQQAQAGETDQLQVDAANALQAIQQDFRVIGAFAATVRGTALQQTIAKAEQLQNAFTLIKNADIVFEAFGTLSNPTIIRNAQILALRSGNDTAAASLQNLSTYLTDVRTGAAAFNPAIINRALQPATGAAGFLVDAANVGRPGTFPVVP